MKVNISEDSQTFCKNGSIERFQKSTVKEKQIIKKPVMYTCTKPTTGRSLEKVVAVLITATSIGIAGIAIIKNKSVKDELKKTAKKLLEKDKKLKETEEKYKQKITNINKTESSQKIKKENIDLNQNNTDFSEKPCITSGYTKPENRIKQKDKRIANTQIIKIPQNQIFNKRDFFGYMEDLITRGIDNFCNFIRNL